MFPKYVLLSNHAFLWVHFGRSGKFSQYSPFRCIHIFSKTGYDQWNFFSKKSWKLPLFTSILFFSQTTFYFLLFSFFLPSFSFLTCSIFLFLFFFLSYLSFVHFLSLLSCFPFFLFEKVVRTRVHTTYLRPTTRWTKNARKW